MCTHSEEEEEEWRKLGPREKELGQVKRPKHNERERFEIWVGEGERESEGASIFRYAAMPIDHV